MTSTKAKASAFRAHAIAWINERHDERTVQQAALDMAKLDGRLARLEDKLIDDVIDQELYARKREEILLRRQRLQERLAVRDHRARLIAKLDGFLELGKTLSVIYRNAIPAGKRDLVGFATSNRLCC